ncbi:preprotein translocase subunit YajC [Akkermansiaceae bacterium]|nr:preprotein translocase subunit YajC [Akkermansiaceae bacterium]MDB4418919.1 preprotein translocase subunit YajC [bacterium]MDA8968926.1 preprotein translocase subunit YajC [Akkermansiaceae bacterium]MDB4273083.1 preprotein translocase subunit YajC [Akkermansiaceae bacterium]MDB4373697.1 preprotein translocase subunit YajC [Akkermansiaceae bacterium]
MTTLSFLAADPQPGLFGNPLVMIVLMMVMFYFLLIRPQQKQKKELAARVSSMAKGDKIITIGGIHGSVHHISEKTVTIKLSEGVFVPFEKSSIQTVEKVGKGSKKVEKIKVEPVDDKA